MKLNERHLVQLAAVVDAGGVSEGAAMLGLTQPAVSRSLSMLEARVGEPLFLCGRRPLQATALGLRLATHGRTILAASRMASDAVTSHVRGAAGHVRLGGVPFFMDAMIAGMVAAFQTREPDVSVEQAYGHAPDLKRALEGGQIDLAVVPLGHEDTGGGFDFTPILPGRNIVAARTGHPLLRKRRLRPEDLAAFPWVAPLPGSPLLADLQGILAGLGVSGLNVRFSGGSLMSVVNYMAECDALAVLPHSVVFAQRREARIGVVPFAAPQPNRTLGVLRHARAARNPAADRLAAHVVAAFEELRHLIQRHENAVVWQR
jgi:DNA-binding transcriptional LysR family regulator